jgi:hypothetical protein
MGRELGYGYKASITTINYQALSRRIENCAREQQRILIAMTSLPHRMRSLTLVRQESHQPLPISWITPSFAIYQYSMTILLMVKLGMTFTDSQTRTLAFFRVQNFLDDADS